MAKSFNEIKVDGVINLNENGKLYESSGRIIYDNGDINVLSTSGSFSIAFNASSSNTVININKDVNYNLITNGNDSNGNVYVSNNGIVINHHRYKVFCSITFKSSTDCDVLTSLLDNTGSKNSKISAICGKTVKKNELITLQTMGITNTDTHLINMIIRCSDDTDLEIVDWCLIMSKL